jgi:hypothetical protein
MFEKVSTPSVEKLDVRSYWCALQLPNGVRDWLARLLPIREVPCSHLGPDTGYPD